jgi:CPSF A subunit region
LLFQVIVQEESAGEGRPKLKLLMEEVCKGAVSAVTSVEGLLSVAVGPKLLFYQYDETKKIIVGKAFFDCQVGRLFSPSSLCSGYCVVLHSVVFLLCICTVCVCVWVGVGVFY